MPSISDLEFNGPFADWWNVVTDFGADPSGVADSTGAFQQMLNAMAGDGGGHIKSGNYRGWTGYIPNGTYKISSTLLLPDASTSPVAEGVNLWGQDPSRTVLKWAGDSGAVMLWSDGCHSSTIGRITFDGQDVAALGLRLERNPSIGLQNTYSRLQDCTFKDLQTGFAETNYESSVGGLDSEFSILRCKFYRCTDAGVRIMKAEAYNFWVRQCYFEDCNYGIANGPSGAFNAYDNVFVGSTTFDIYATSMRICGIRRNYSLNAKRFLYVNSSNVVIEGNNVVEPVETDAIHLQDRVKVMILNNRIKSRSEATTGPVVKELTNQFLSDTPAPFALLFVFFNQFTVESPISITPRTTISNDMEGNLVQPLPEIPMPALPPTPPQIVRQTFIIDTAAEDPQDTVDAAAAYATAHPDSNPVVYLPSWSESEHFMLFRTLVFPANIKMSLQGGGRRAIFYWNPATVTTSPNPYVLFRGPSKVSVLNLMLGSSAYSGGKHGITAVFDNCDQVESRIYADNCQGYYHFLGVVNSVADLCDHVSSAFADENIPAVISGLGQVGGCGRILHEGGAGSSGSSATEPQLSLLEGGRFELRDFWYETTSTDKQWAALDGMGGRRGEFTIQSSFIEQHTSPSGWAMKMIEATDWWGDILYVDDIIVGATQLSGNASRVNYLSFGGGAPVLPASATPATMYRQDGNSPGTVMDTWENNGGYGVFGTKPEDWRGRLWQMTNRAPVLWVDPLGDGITDARLHRVLGDVAFMSGRYILPSTTEVTDFMSGILPADATFSRASGATMYALTYDASSALQVFGPENLFPASQDLSNLAWALSSDGTGSNPVVTPNDALAPDGTMTASRVDFDAGSGTTSGDWSLITTDIMQLFRLDRFSSRLWFKGASGTQMLVLGINTGSWSSLTCTGGWQALQADGATYGGSGTTLTLGIRQDLAGTINSTATVWIWGLQVSRLLTNGSYLLTDGTPRFDLRFDHDPFTGGLLGALVEPQSTNHVTRSDARWHAWTTTNASASPYDVMAPNQWFWAITITAAAGLADHYAGSPASGAGAGAVVAHSAVVKQGTTRYVVVLDNSDAVWHGATFDFDTGAWVGLGTNVTLLPPIKMMDGWWRLAWVATMTNNVGAVMVAPTPNGTGTASDINYDAAGTEKVYATGLQIDSPDLGLTSYIPTFDGSDTRSADVLKILRDNGTYDIAITRQDGVQLLTDQVISDGTFTVPTNTSHLIRIETTRK